MSRKRVKKLMMRISVLNGMIHDIEKELTLLRSLCDHDFVRQAAGQTITWTCSKCEDKRVGCRD